VSASPAAPQPICKVLVRIQVGKDRMSGSDDPLFLQLDGPGGREFRLALAHGKQLRRGNEDTYVLAGPDDPDTNVAHPDLNDPSSPPLDLGAVERVVIRKGLEPLPNVRGFGEMDDRLQIERAEVELYPAGSEAPRCFVRGGGHWLGLVCGLRLELPSVDAAR